MAKRFFYVSLGILALAIAFHLGAQSAKATSQEIVAGGGSYLDWIVTAEGDVYYCSSNIYDPSAYPWTCAGNIWGSTATGKASWGGIKEQFRK